MSSTVTDDIDEDGTPYVRRTLSSPTPEWDGESRPGLK